MCAAPTVSAITSPCVFKRGVAVFAGDSCLKDSPSGPDSLFSFPPAAAGAVVAMVSAACFLECRCPRGGICRERLPVDGERSCRGLKKLYIGVPSTPLSCVLLEVLLAPVFPINRRLLSPYEAPMLSARSGARSGATALHGGRTRPPSIAF
ncbi:hypothetical protein GDO81_025664 [Engystomops pustulosus]|uniref:Uncharacterized protein n=1 Tax=Engystomops pustulosus TaxID=76066 RepID=A0AAV6YPC4_ENGPU|nr:hypothetical protein GDO81_025664 [Engystomops pustulosus]